MKDCERTLPGHYRVVHDRSMFQATDARLGLLGKRPRIETLDGIEQLRILPRRSWKLVVTALALIVMKDLQGALHILDHRDWFEDVMVIVYLCLFLFWLVAFVGEFFGSEIVRVTRGELVISRGIGPLRRTFHFSGTGIAELVSSDPAVDEKGKRHLHHIFLKPKTGTVRFIYAGHTWYFAEWLEEAEGETVVRWLKPKLPRTATEPLPLEYGGAANFRP